MNDDKVADQIGNIRLYNGNCMDWMKNVPDKWYNLAIVDPPYQLSKSSTTGSGKLKNRALNVGNIAERWDKKSSKEYFDELFRISKNQIIWGGNYFDLPPCRCFVCWDKMQFLPTFSQCEFAWTSFNKPAKLFKYRNNGDIDGNKIHPTQKPIQLYAYLLNTFAKEGDKIFDSHFGSLSIGIACMELGYEMDACEIDEEYYNNALGRIKDFEFEKLSRLF